ncbi:MAG: hypothetical protein K2K34_02400, partial [Oscillospiraceae bacterium]|nr:hypothetical protein [Oscillospiraceae bacterium]
MKRKRDDHPAFRKRRKSRRIAGLVTAFSICAQFLSGFGGISVSAETDEDFGNITGIATPPGIGIG